MTNSLDSSLQNKYPLKSAVAKGRKKIEEKEFKVKISKMPQFSKGNHLTSSDCSYFVHWDPLS